MKFSTHRLVPVCALALLPVVASCAQLTTHGSPVAEPAPFAASASQSRLAEFSARRRGGAGRFVTDSVLSAHADQPLVSVLRSYLAGFARSMDAQYPTSFSVAPSCYVDVYVDGVHSASPIDDIPTSRVAAAEFYDRTLVPAQYRRVRSPCEVLLLWLK